MSTPTIDTDAKLRRYGYKIFSRAGNARALWEKDGKLFTVTEALTQISSEVKRVESGK